MIMPENVQSDLFSHYLKSRHAISEGVHKPLSYLQILDGFLLHLIFFTTEWVGLSDEYKYSRLKQFRHFYEKENGLRSQVME